MTAAVGGGSVVAGNGPLMVWDKVEADYHGNGKYYPGKISRVHNDGTYDVDYDDGEKETKVEQKLIRLVAKNTIVPVAYTTLVQGVSAGTSTLQVTPLPSIISTPPPPPIYHISHFLSITISLLS